MGGFQPGPESGDGLAQGQLASGPGLPRNTGGTPYGGVRPAAAPGGLVGHGAAQEPPTRARSTEQGPRDSSRGPCGITSEARG